MTNLEQEVKSGGRFGGIGERRRTVMCGTPTATGPIMTDRDPRHSRISRGMTQRPRHLVEYSKLCVVGSSRDHSRPSTNRTWLRLVREHPLLGRLGNINGVLLGPLCNPPLRHHHPCPEHPPLERPGIINGPFVALCKLIFRRRRRHHHPSPALRTDIADRFHPRENPQRRPVPRPSLAR